MSTETIPEARPSCLKERWKTNAQRLLRMHYESRVGHIGGNLSALDILLAIHHDVMEDGDQFVLSKGHAAGALYVTLWSRGLIPDEWLSQFHRDNTLLSGHPPASGLPGILFATGSLGHGTGLAAGLALSRRLRAEPGRVFCLTSDGEWNEGSSWESLMFARHQQLSNLTIVVDVNGLQGFGTTREVSGLDHLLERFQAFGVTAVDVDGHDGAALASALRSLPHGGPLCLLARTVKGHGVSFMENRMEWHYLPMTEEQHGTAQREVANA